MAKQNKPPKKDVRDGSGVSAMKESEETNSYKNPTESDELQEEPTTSEEFLQSLEKLGVSPEDAVTILLGKTVKRRTPEEEYKDWKRVVNDNNLTEEEIYAVLDSFLEQGEYCESYSVRGRLRFTLGTRNVSVHDKLLKELTNQTILNDGILPQEDSDRITYEYNLAGSLKVYKDSVRSISEDLESLEDKLDFVKSLPEPVFNLLTTKLQLFDIKVYLATRAAAIEDF